MNRFLLLACAILLISLPATAQVDCPELAALRALYDVRDAMVHERSSSWEISRRLERQLEALREPLPGGGYRWVQWVRPVGEGPLVKREHVVRSNQQRGEVETFEAAATAPYAVRVVVPRKRSLIRANHPVWVGSVQIRYWSEGEVQTIDKGVNEWLRPNSSKSFDLGEIADRAQVTVQTATSGSTAGESLIEIHFRQAVSRDDPTSPHAEIVDTLKLLQASPEPLTVDLEIARLERRLFPDVASIPLATLVARLREAEALMSSEKEEERAKVPKAIEEIVRLLPR
ncbi:MAG TPA: hypothetical protein VM557_11390 [Thermoanaerobaculia bacterium]|nr:hypothetical protein [Thermoanaerobaculia bacterium]